MSEFKPVFPSHAIERCVASWIFHPNLPDKAFDNFKVRFQEFFVDKGFEVGPVPIGFNVDAATGKLAAVNVGVPATYKSIDGRWIVYVAADHIGLATERYQRWSGFEGGVKKYIAPLLKNYSDIVSPAAIKLEYWDRFNWSGSWDDFDIARLLKDKEIVPETASREWHNHSGWFEYDEYYRRLYNINVDVTDVMMAPTSPSIPSVGIYTMASDQVHLEHLHLLEGLEASMERLQFLHQALKERLSILLNDEMNRRIGLI